LAFALSLAAIFGVVPAVLHFRPPPAPVWVWLVLFVALLEGAFTVWMIVTPDWATLRVVMLLLLVVAIGYGLVAVDSLGVFSNESLPWGLDSVRPWVARWCTSVLLVTALGAYLCGHISRKWRRAFKLQRAHRVLLTLRREAQTSSITLRR
jgi:hypothetical protein